MTIPIYLLRKIEYIFHNNNNNTDTECCLSKIQKCFCVKKKKVRICLQPEYIFYTANYFYEEEEEEDENGNKRYEGYKELTMSESEN